MFTRSEQGLRLLGRNDPHVGSPESRDEDLLSTGSGIQQARISSQGSKRDRLHVRQYVRHTGP